MPNWEKKHIEILKNEYYEKGTFIEELLNEGFTRPAIQTKARRLELNNKHCKYPPKERKKVLDRLTKDIVSDYNNGMTMNHLSKKYDCSIDIILHLYSNCKFTSCLSTLWATVMVE